MKYKVVKRSQIDGEFEGFNESVLFKLVDGSFWIQDEYKYWYHYAYCPTIRILDANGRSYLQVNGQQEIVAIRKITNVIESQIDGEFNGWEGNTKYKLTNGQIWQQEAYEYEYTYSYMPSAFVYEVHGRCKMQVEGTTVDVRRIN